MHIRLKEITVVLPEGGLTYVESITKTEREYIITTLIPRGSKRDKKVRVRFSEPS